MTESTVRPTVWITESFRDGEPRFGWKCSGCDVERVGIKHRQMAHEDGAAHRCAESTPAVITGKGLDSAGISETGAAPCA